MSSFYTQQLHKLMKLHATKPHLSCCIIPNRHKQASQIEPALVLYQLTCSGMLEGVRICILSFPNAPLDKVLDRPHQGLLPAGVLGFLEELCDEKVTKMIWQLQGKCYRRLQQKDFLKRNQQRNLLTVVQQVFSHFGWFPLVQKTRPLIGMLNIEEEIWFLKEANTQALIEAEFKISKKWRLKVANTHQIKTSKQPCLIPGAGGQNGSPEVRPGGADGAAVGGAACMRRGNARRGSLSPRRTRSSACGNLLDKEVYAQKVEHKRSNRGSRIRNLNGNIFSKDKLISKLNKERRFLQEVNSKASKELAQANEKVFHLSMVESKLEQTLDQLEDSLERECRKRTEKEKQPRKIEMDVKLAGEGIQKLEKGRKELKKCNLV